MIDVNKEELNISITEDAIRQIQLIRENDFTVSDKVFRLKIDGKGCSGFDYALGFTVPENDDLTIEVHNIQINIDPFSAYYCKDGEIDFILDPKHNIDGFHFENHNQKEYRGKFFKNEEKTPKLK